MNVSSEDLIRSKLFFFLALLRAPARLRALRQLCGPDDYDVVMQELLLLTKRGLILEEKEKVSWRALTDQTRGALGEMACRLYSGEEDALLGGLYKLWKGEVLAGCDLLIPIVNKLLQDDKCAGALLCLNILLHNLTAWRYTEQTNQENSEYLNVVAWMLGIALYMATALHATGALLATALNVARAMGDKRMALRLRLLRISHEYLVGGPEVEDPNSAIENLLVETQQLGDPDILSCVAYGVGLQQYAGGKLKKAVDTLRDLTHRLNDIPFLCFRGMDMQVLSSPACCLGRFDIALGRLVGHLNLLDLCNDLFALKWTKVQAADILLRAGFPEKALEIMSDAFACCDEAAEPRLAVWGYRNLAFYHFQRNNIGAAYHMLRQGIALAQQCGVGRPFFGFSHTYDLLWACIEHGYPPLPEHHSLEFLLHYSLGSASPQWQGIALRIRAKQLLKQGGSHETAVLWLEDSLERLHKSESILEEARTGVMLAQSLRALGRLIEADALHDKYYAVLTAYRQYDGAPPPHKGEAPAAGLCVERCSKAFASLYSWLSFEDYTQRLVDSILDSLRLERMALFAVDEGGGLTRLADKHFSAEELASQDFAPHYVRMAESLRNGRNEIHSNRSGAYVYMPISVPEERDCVILGHCAFLTEHITEQTGECFDQIRGMLENELRTAFRLQRNLEVRRKEHSKLAKLAAQRLNRDEKLYYGPSMQEVLLKADKAAATDAPVLILGETGVGKEELAKRIHDSSGRVGTFVAVHLASIPEQLFESEIFGHEKGAFTDAHRQKVGLLELAHNGTLFIDEVGDIPPSLQVKLLRVLQEKKFIRLGGTREIHSDFRLMSATNQDLEKRVQEKAFREDLYYRIAVVPLHLPPLRARPEDIRRMAHMFYSYFAARYQRLLPELTEKELNGLCAYSWPGNVRELKSFIERAVILHDASAADMLFAEAPFNSEAQAHMPAAPPEAAPRPKVDAELALVECPPAFNQLPTMKELQRLYIQHVLSLTKGKIEGKGGAMAILGMKRSTLYTKIREYGLDKATLLYGSQKQASEDRQDD